MRTALCDICGIGVTEANNHELTLNPKRVTGFNKKSYMVIDLCPDCAEYLAAHIRCMKERIRLEREE